MPRLRTSKERKTYQLLHGSRGVSRDWKSHATFIREKEALVIAAAASSSLGRTHYVDGKFIASDLCFILTPKIAAARTHAAHFLQAVLKEAFAPAAGVAA